MTRIYQEARRSKKFGVIPAMMTISPSQKKLPTVEVTVIATYS